MIEGDRSLVLFYTNISCAKMQIWSSMIDIRVKLAAIDCYFDRMLG
jgi:hypothetical protein